MQPNPRKTQTIRRLGQVDIAALRERVLAAAVAPYGYERGDYPRVMLARLAPGGVIQPHRDAIPAAK